jgi:hypothetical protein
VAKSAVFEFPVAFEDYAIAKDAWLITRNSSPNLWETEKGGTDPPDFSMAPYGSPVGATGGPLPYKLSGATDSPVITKLNVPAIVSATSGINVEIEVEKDSVGN